MIKLSSKALSVAGLSLLMLAGACASKPKTDDQAVVTNPVTNGGDIGSSTIATPEADDDKPLSNLSPAEIARINQEIISVGDRVYFDTDSQTLNDTGREILGKQAKIIMKNPKLKVIIDGNADERGTREYNLALGARRANAAKDYLISLGVNSTQVDTVSFGKERPIDTRSNAEGWAKNRNAHTSAQ